MFGKKKIDAFAQTVLGYVSNNPGNTLEQIVQKQSPSGMQRDRVIKSLDTLKKEGLVEQNKDQFFTKQPITEERVIWYPGIYGGRTEGPYGQKVADVSLVELTKLVQDRAKEDGEWLIANGHVGENNENEDAMRAMMAFVSKEENIQQCVSHILKEEMETVRTVDFVCRELANASKWAHGTSDDE